MSERSLHLLRRASSVSSCTPRAALGLTVATVLVGALAPAVTQAQQPLSAFLQSARQRGLDVREASAALEQSESQYAEARARLLPSFNATAQYTRNEREIAVMLPGSMTQAVLTPLNQLDGRVTLTVPILDLSAIATMSQTDALADLSRARLEVTQQNVDVAVVQVWHQVVAARAYVGAAARTLALAQRARDDVSARVEAGTAARGELARAEAEVARATQATSEADLAVVLAERNLEVLSGLRPDGQQVALEDALEEEAPLATFMSALDHLPSVELAQREVDAAERGRTAAWTSLLPTVAAQATERVTNAAGFGASHAWLVAVFATWNLDFGRTAMITTRQAGVEGAEVRYERARQTAETSIYEAWHRVRTLRARVAAAQESLRASTLAADDARARFESGAGTQLDQIVAERDRFNAEVSALQAVADLRVARALLRLRAGRSL